MRPHDPELISRLWDIDAGDLVLARTIAGPIRLRPDQRTRTRAIADDLVAEDRPRGRRPAQAQRTM
jgi:hypothetical protein